LQLAKENSLSALEKAIQDAKKQCDEASANECASAWDTVEELSAAIAHKKAQVSSPILGSCGLVPINGCAQQAAP
jgi:hypothetical protein